MVFAPTRNNSPLNHEPAAAPKRREHIEPGSVPASDRLRWRAVIHSRDRDGGAQTTWHLVGCSGPKEASAHCAEGQQLMASTGSDPDGHCLVDGHCPRCAQHH